MTTNVKPKILIIGLGPGNPDHLTMGALKAMQTTGIVWLRTAKHPTVSHLPKEIKLEAFDDYYDRLESFTEVYGAIVEKLVTLAQESEKPIAYAVPGHPLVGESSVTRLIKRADEMGIATEVIDGLSFIEPVCTALRLDPLQVSLTIIDATELAARPEEKLPRELGLELPMLRPLLIGQVYNQRLAPPPPPPPQQRKTGTDGELPGYSPGYNYAGCRCAGRGGFAGSAAVRTGSPPGMD